VLINRILGGVNDIQADGVVELCRLESAPLLQDRIRGLCGRGLLEHVRCELRPKPAGSAGRSPRWYLVGPHAAVQRSVSASPAHNGHVPPAARRRGRPPGSRNKPKPATAGPARPGVGPGGRVYVRVKGHKYSGSIGTLTGARAGDTVEVRFADGVTVRMDLLQLGKV
jgi:hypothetical protein